MLEVSLLSRTTHMATRRGKAGSDCVPSRAVVSKAGRAKKTVLLQLEKTQ